MEGFGRLIREPKGFVKYSIQCFGDSNSKQALLTFHSTSDVVSCSTCWKANVISFIGIIPGNSNIDPALHG